MICWKNNYFKLSMLWNLIMMFFWVLVPCRLVGRWQRFAETHSIFRVEDGESASVPIFGPEDGVCSCETLASTTAQKPRRTSSSLSFSARWKTRILQMSSDLVVDGNTCVHVYGLWCSELWRHFVVWAVSNVLEEHWQPPTRLRLHHKPDGRRRHGKQLSHVKHLICYIYYHVKNEMYRY
jgi:hypothetical protein